MYHDESNGQVRNTHNVQNKERTDGLRSLQRLNVEGVAAPMRELFAVHGDLHPLADASGGIILRLVGAHALSAVGLLDPPRGVGQHPLPALFALVAELVAGVLGRRGGGAVGGTTGGEHDEQEEVTHG